jgi:hypothetical protein
LPMSIFLFPFSFLTFPFSTSNCLRSLFINHYLNIVFIIHTTNGKSIDVQLPFKKSCWHNSDLTGFQ